jgi:hypothetical protein
MTSEEMVEVEMPAEIPVEGAFVRKRGRKPKPKTILEKQIVTRLENVIEVRKWTSASLGCLVGFVAKTFAIIYGTGLNGRVVEVTDILSQSAFETDRIRSDSLNGLARVVILQ